jgi:CheY-like chemotaxis protein
MEEEREAKEGNLVGKVILIVDDDDTLLRLTSFPFRAQGATVLTAQNGREALEIIRGGIEENQPKIDLIVTDYSMPLMDGEELLEALGESDDTRNIPFIFSSGDLDKHLEERLSGEPRVKSFLKKPFLFAELIAAAKEALK